MKMSNYFNISSLKGRLRFSISLFIVLSVLSNFISIWLFSGESDTLFRIASIIVIILVLVIVGFFMMTRLSNQVEVPIHYLLQGTKAIQAGTYDYRLQDKTITYSTSELNELCHTFNEMAATIKRNVENLEQSEQRYRSLIELSPEGVFLLGQDNRIVFVNEQAAEMMRGNSVNDLIGKNYYELLHPSQLQRVKRHINEIKQANNRRKTTELQFKRLDGREIEVEVGSTIINYHGKPAILGVFRDITERKKAERKLQEANELFRWLSTIDGLTGVGNRRSFDNDISSIWEKAKENNRSVALLLLDIDFFKNYNDTYGHIAGDECLKNIALTIEEVSQLKDGKVYRYGGEEFAILLEGNEEKAVELAQDIHITICNLNIPHMGSSIANIVTVSIGISVLCDQPSEIIQFVNLADEALYIAKQTGKNRYVLSSKSLACS